MAVGKMKRVKKKEASTNLRAHLSEDKTGPFNTAEHSPPGHRRMANHLCTRQDSSFHVISRRQDAVNWDPTRHSLEGRKKHLQESVKHSRGVSSTRLTYTSHVKKVAKDAAWKQLSCIPTLRAPPDAQGVRHPTTSHKYVSLMELLAPRWSSCPRHTSDS
ncbi:hypothetical protein GWK47_035579 [Chionoecetes opilio]|uniref:Uncharacterized protein n=1 Tax=Chionoecetes opilio TaxID=41210 RepID=A0A8J5CZD5_CHIOP|nr:hypothetical protein GWK47_035579 [Chionoecetes opilio]